ncbi:glycosyltransferase family 39 protein [Blastococcus sp. PRF04-17]|uniref:glycosyltransferase family 39 protein n=1 Tax=Blastococcus sp. PRF04-17 TaxID=2933797 RepID=UPI001FF42E34|nr:glycosyltransferase family 39 protein [Blastococcus sp. PRF04-17]UOY01213.1 glycosyltransferase family 39 protein [Blastococcus sp. PRF04-17]
MTADVRESERRLSPERSGTRTGSDAVWSAVASIPERLLLAFLVFCYVSAVAYVGGFFRPVVVAPVTLVLVALTWWFLPAGGGRTVWSAVGSLLALGVSGAWFLLNLPYLGERIRVGRDPDVYTLAALWLLNNRSPEIPVPPGSTEASGFYLVDGVLEPQGNHLVAAVSASAGWVFGENAVFWGNLACGAAALLALYVLGRRLVGPLWALVPVLALAVSLPMLEFSRAMYSEPLALTFTFLGASLLWDAWKSDRLPAYVAAGVAFGGVALARIDGTLPLIGVVGGLAVAAVVHPGPPGVSGAGRQRRCCSGVSRDCCSASPTCTSTAAGTSPTSARSSRCWAPRFSSRRCSPPRPSWCRHAATPRSPAWSRGPRWPAPLSAPWPSPSWPRAPGGTWHGGRSTCP